MGGILGTPYSILDFGVAPPSESEAGLRRAIGEVRAGAVFVVIAVLEFFIHGVLLSDMYRQTASVWRPEAEMLRRSP